MKICIFEDEKFDQFYPLTYFRPIFELKCGATKLREKIERFYKDCEVSYWMREVLVPVFKKQLPRVNHWDALKGDDVIFINGRLLLLDNNDIPSLLGGEEVGMKDGSVLYARVKKERMATRMLTDFHSFIGQLQSELPTKEVNFHIISYPWNLVHHNGAAVKSDFAYFGGPSIEGEIHSQACIYGDKNVRIAKGAKVHPFVVLDTTLGPIMIEEGAEILPFARIEGPTSIGKNTLILGAARIREGTSIGPMCRVGGEVEESIIHGHSNKYHDGFLGHAYLCEWVNLGALTTNSDLKNDYSTVSVYMKGQLMDSGDTKVGSFIGDHTKTSIGVFMNTGASLGVMCNVVANGSVTPKFIPSFCWFLNNSFSKGYGFKMQVDTARIAMSRRKVNLTDEDIALMKYVHEITKTERENAVAKSRM